MDLRSKNEVMLQMQTQEVEEYFRENRGQLKMVSDWFRKALGFDMLIVLLDGYFVIDWLMDLSEINLLGIFVLISLIPFAIAAYSSYCRSRVGIYVGMASSVLTCALMVMLTGSNVLFLLTGLATAGITVIMKSRTLKMLALYEEIIKRDGYPFERASQYVKKINTENKEYQPAPEPVRTKRDWDDDVLPPVSLDDWNTME